MWKPDDSLDDYIVTPTPPVTSEPPREISLRRTGEVEVLKPLTRTEVYGKHSRTALKLFRPNVRRQPLWFRRFVAVGSAALVMVAMVLVSAILVGINDQAVGPAVVINEEPADALTQPGEPFSFDLFSPSDSAPVTRPVDVVRSNTRRRRSARPSIRLAANKPKRRSRQSPKLEQPKFVPTTLVIYAENGLINTRIEPWLQTGDKKIPTFSN